MLTLLMQRFVLFGFVYAMHMAYKNGGFIKRVVPTKDVV